MSKTRRRRVHAMMKDVEDKGEEYVELSRPSFCDYNTSSNDNDNDNNYNNTGSTDFDELENEYINEYGSAYAQYCARVDKEIFGIDDCVEDEEGNDTVEEVKSKGTVELQQRLLQKQQNRNRKKAAKKLIKKEKKVMIRSMIRRKKRKMIRKKKRKVMIRVLQRIIIIIWKQKKRLS